MIIRPATAQDADRIATVWNPQIRDTAVTFNAVEKTAADIRAMIKARHEADRAFLVAEEAGSITGFATYDQFRGGIGYARTMEHTVILAPDAKGRGIGRALLAAIEDHARRRGVHSLFAGVSGENQAGVGFHLALGYVTVAVLPQVGFKFGRWMDLHLMQKLL